MSELAARARGLTTRLASAAGLDALDAAGDVAELEAALASSGILGTASLVGGDGASALFIAEAIEQVVRDRCAEDLAILARWGGRYADALAALALDDDRRSLRALVRGIAAGSPIARRLGGAVPTPTLPVPVLEQLAQAVSIEELRAQLAQHGHPLAGACVETRRGEALDSLEVELALARRFVAIAQRELGRAGAAAELYLTQLADTENAAAAILVAARGGELRADDLYLARGRLVDRDTFAAGCAGPVEEARPRLAAALAGTPLAAAIFASAPAALEDAALEWQLATQARLRRCEPEGLAPVLYLVLARRREARRLRAAVWRVALRGSG